MIDLAAAAQWSQGFQINCGFGDSAEQEWISPFTSFLLVALAVQVTGPLGGGAAYVQVDSYQTYCLWIPDGQLAGGAVVHPFWFFAPGQSLQLITDTTVEASITGSGFILPFGALE